MVKKTTKILKKLKREGIKFDSRKKLFTSSKRKPISKMDRYNCGEISYLAQQCTNPKKNKYMGKKDDANGDDKKNTKVFKKRNGKNRQLDKRKRWKVIYCW